MGRLNDKVALISGGGAGIGRASAMMFAAEGAKVVVADKRFDLAVNSAEEIVSEGGIAIAVEADVTCENSVQRAIAKVDQSFGGLDIVFNCAGVSPTSDGTVTEVDMSVWNSTLDVNLRGTFLCCRHAIPLLIKRGGGSIINMSSWAALSGRLTKHIYAASKGGVISLTRAIAGEYSKKGIRANVICPGSIRTERWVANTPGQAYGAELVRLAEAYPFSIGGPEDIAAIVVFLASPESRMLTGAVIPADGGRTAF